MVNLELQSRLVEVQSRIEAAAVKAGRGNDEVQLIVVTKNNPAQLVFENKNQEAEPKAFEVSQGNTFGLSPTWHFVGQLQSNKVKSVLEYAQVLHSLDRPSLLSELKKQLAKDESRRLEVFIELNLTGDPNRGGIEPENLLAFAEQVLEVPQLTLLGVMGVAGLDVAPEIEFQRIAAASQNLITLSPQAKYISAGMSGDYEIAIEFGATHARIGTAITGPRQYP
jgi:pyridoxal phosphate enzyme (YggS family)